MNTSRARVLIADDDAASRRLLDVRLRGLQCEVMMVSSGEEALSRIRKDQPDLVLLDLQMPHIDGIEVLRRLRKDGAPVPVIVVTAHGSIEIAVEAMKEGAYDFVTKPLDPKHLEIAVCKALERESLKREIEIFAEDAEKRYRLVVGNSDNMKVAVETARRAATSNATSCYSEKAGRAKRSLPEPSITGAREKRSHSLPSTVWDYPESC